MNYFGAGMDAERYVRARPRIHATAIDKFRAFAHIDTPLSNGLDMGCGTGQSTIALAEVAASVIGIDPSAEMLAHAVPHPSVGYQQAAAERVPWPNESFDIVSVALAFHWLDANGILAEASRLLRASGWLLIYNSVFTGTMVEDAGFSIWFKTFLDRFPTPPRHRVAVTDTLASSHGLRLCGEEPFTNDIAMTASAFVDYELSTTNLIAATQSGSATADEAAAWMRELIEPFFGDSAERTFRFAGTIAYVMKQTDTPSKKP